MGNLRRNVGLGLVGIVAGMALWLGNDSNKEIKNNTRNNNFNYESDSNQLVICNYVEDSNKNGKIEFPSEYVGIKNDFPGRENIVIVSNLSRKDFPNLSLKCTYDDLKAEYNVHEDKNNLSQRLFNLKQIDNILIPGKYTARLFSGNDLISEKDFRVSPVAEIHICHDWDDANGNGFEDIHEYRGEKYIFDKDEYFQVRAVWSSDKAHEYKLILTDHFGEDTVLYENKVETPGTISVKTGLWDSIKKKGENRVKLVIDGKTVVEEGFEIE